MCFKWCRHPLITVVALVAGCLATACSGTTSDQREPGASSGASPAAIAIETTSSYLTIENRAGLPLVDVRIAVKATNGLSFATLITRLETGAKRDLPFGDLRSNDGTTFSPQWQRPREILVTATDLVGKKYDMTVPWKR